MEYFSASAKNRHIRERLKTQLSPSFMNKIKQYQFIILYLTHTTEYCDSCKLNSAVILLFPSAGTPKGVGPVKIGQRIEAGITDILDIHFDVARRNRVIH